MSLALWVAMVSVLFQNYDTLFAPAVPIEALGFIFLSISIVLYPIRVVQPYALYAFCAGLLIMFLPLWFGAANHTWLAVWTLVPLAFLGKWWEDDTYLLYLRITVGMVMIVAALQKVIAGTYLDGSYIAWMAYNGSYTEQLPAFLCGSGVCGWFAALGIIAVVWQLLVGALILSGSKNVWFFAFEISFLVAVGLYADEMNFQVLNIALVCMMFRIGMPVWLAVVCLAFLVIDYFSVGSVLATIFS